jgi:hypothetical protein
MGRTARRQAMSLGPWQQGLFNAGPIEDVPANCFFDVLNLDVMENGVLAARRGYHDLDCGGGRTSPVVSILGNAWESSEQYVLIQRTSTGPTLTELLSLKSGAPVVYSTTYDDRVFTSAVKYAGIVYFVSDVTGKAVTATTALGGVALAASANIPGGHDAKVIKDRLFVVNKTTSRIYYSKATDFTTWTAPDGGFFDVEPGNGQDIKAVIFLGNYIYIFKASGTYLFTFTTDPGVDGYLRKISEVGGEDAIDFEGSVYFINRTGLYRLINTAIELVSKNVDVSLIPNPRLFRIRELIIFNNNNLACFYIFNSRTKSWSKYDNTVAATTRPNKMWAESFEITFGQRLTWVTRGNSGVLTSYNTNVPANGQGDNRDYHLGDPSSLGIAPTYYLATGLVAPGGGLKLSRLYGITLDVTAKHAHNAQISTTLSINNNSNRLTDVSLVADIPTHGDAVHDGISWSGVTRAYNSTPDSPVDYRVWSFGVKCQYTTNSEDSLFNFEVRNIYAIVAAEQREVDTVSTVANS